MILENIIAGQKSSKGTDFMQSTDPNTQALLPEEFFAATEEEVNEAATAAYDAWKSYKKTTGKEKATFLRTIASEIMELGDDLVFRAMAESGLPEGRIRGERGRTCNQLELFANHIEEGSWVDAIIDEAIPDRKPIPRVDIRKMFISSGPVAIFTASNFPLAFSTAGGDTASALAAGCPVIVKANPAHLGTNALVAEAITRAAEKCNMPAGVFSSLNGGIAPGQQLVRHPKIKAVGFTGSQKGGLSIQEIANNRPEPIPVYAEMGSNNPIFILNDKLNAEYNDIAKTIAGSVNLGAGQFCTNPGLIVLEESEITLAFLEALKDEFTQLQSATMLNEGIFTNYNKGRQACINSKGVSALYEAQNSSGEWIGQPAIASVSARHFLQNNHLQEEVFGPFTLVVFCQSKDEVMEVASTIQGQLTATIMATAEELTQDPALVDVLSDRAGRVLFNNVPTGVEVCQAMHHGGPFPSSSNALYTSVGTDAIKRFVKPICFQNMPADLLPMELQPENPLNIWRIVNGQKTKK